MPSLYLIDGHAQFFRAYYAIRAGLSSPVTGEPTNLTFGFVGMILKVLREYRPDHLAVVIDRAGDRDTFRSRLYPAYKANRKEPPDDFRPQVQRCLSILDQMHVPVVAMEGTEADDVIASLVRRLRPAHPNLDITIVSKDKDLAQLLDEHVRLFDVHTDLAVTAADIFKTPGVRPDQVVDILALMGDSVDNIPGVEGIGPKTAAQLIQEFGSLDGVLAHLDKIKGKRRENIEAARDRLPMNRELVRLRDELTVDFDLDAARVDPERIPVEALAATFRELGFSRHTQDLKALRPAVGGSSVGGSSVGGSSVAGPGVDRAGADRMSPVRRSQVRPSQPRSGEPHADDPPADSLFAQAEIRAPREPPRVAHRLLATSDELRGALDEVASAGACALRIVFQGPAAVEPVLCGVALAVETGRPFYLPLRSARSHEHLDLDAALPILRPVLEDAAILKFGHDQKSDINALRHHGVNLAGAACDVMVASYVIDATRSSQALEVLALAFLDHTCVDRSSVFGSGRQQRQVSELEVVHVAGWAAEGADVILRLRDHLRPALAADESLDRLFADVEMPLVAVLAEMEHNGVRVDPAELERQRLNLGRRIEDLRRRIQEAAPHPFNPDSPRQLAQVLFNRPSQDPPGLGLPAQRRVKTGPSTNVEVLEKLAADPRVDSPVPGLIVEYRQLTKLVSTYLIALAQAIHPRTGRVHASFHQTGTATGRLSSSDPNLQNIPIRTEVGRDIRRAFVAGEGRVLLTADYSQVELRLLAHLSEDPALIEAFRRGIDIHTAVAAEVFRVSLSEVTAEQRTTAKMVNFGIIYGITPWGLARRLGQGVSVDEAGATIAQYKRRYGRIDAFLARCIETAASRGYVETILGRRRAIPQIHARQAQQRALGERMAINSVVQGSAADLIKLAMVDLHRALPARFPGARLVLQIHDELVFEVERDQADALRDFVVERMQGAMRLCVELVVEAGWGESLQ